MSEPIHSPTRRAVATGLLATATIAGAAGPAPAHAQPVTASTPPPEPTLVLRARPVREKLAPDLTEPADLWRFEGLGADSVVRSPVGAEIRARLVNETTGPLALHWQGLRGPNATDGVGGLTEPATAPGGTRDIRFTPSEAGTFLLRPLALGAAGPAGGRGVSAMLVVEEKAPPKVDADHALLVRDWRTEPDGQLAPFGTTMEAALGGRLGNRVTVAGADAPKRLELAPGSRVRLRLANGSNARIMRIRFDDLNVSVIAVDSQPTEAFAPLKSSLPFPPGSRYDVIVDAPSEAGKTGTVTALIGAGLPLVQIVTAGTAVAAGERVPLRGYVLPANPALPPEIKLQNAVRKDMIIAGGATRGPDGQPVFTGDPKAVWTVNNTAGSAKNPPLLTAKRGQPVVIGITNRTMFPQPLHLHGHVCRLLHPLDDGWEPYWVDTFQVPEGKTVHVAFLADNPGRWMLGSTVLERLDTGLWTFLDVS
jgi:FtsP/CotA-like multicopper oxidase with cupredoxin domain